jgi:MFS family permease
VASGALLGLVSDRWGPAATIRIGSAFTIAGPLFALVAHMADSGLLIRAYPVVYAALGVHYSSSMLGFYNYMLEIAPDDTRPSYIGLGNTIMGILTLAPTVGGWLLQATSYTVLFGITAALVFLGFLMTLRLAPAMRTIVAESRP